MTITTYAISYEYQILIQMLELDKLGDYFSMAIVILGRLILTEVPDPKVDFISIDPPNWSTRVCMEFNPIPDLPFLFSRL